MIVSFSIANAFRTLFHHAKLEKMADTTKFITKKLPIIDKWSPVCFFYHKE